MKSLCALVLALALALARGAAPTAVEPATLPASAELQHDHAAAELLLRPSGSADERARLAQQQRELEGEAATLLQRAREAHAAAEQLERESRDAKELEAAADAALSKVRSRQEAAKRKLADAERKKLRFADELLLLAVGEEVVVTVSSNATAPAAARGLRWAIAASAAPPVIALLTTTAAQATLRGLAAGTAVLTATLDALTARLDVRVFAPLLVAFPPPSLAPPAIAHGSSLALVLSGGPQAFPLPTALAAAAAAAGPEDAAARLLGKGVRLEVCIAEVGELRSEPACFAQLLAEPPDRLTGEHGSSARLRDVVVVALEDVRPVQLRGGDSGVLLQLLTLRVHCMPGVASGPLNAAFQVSVHLTLEAHVGESSGSAGNASVAVLVDCVAPDAAHVAVLSADAALWDEAMPTPATVSVVANDQELVVATFVTTKDHRVIVNATAALNVQSRKLAVLESAGGRALAGAEALLLLRPLALPFLSSLELANAYPIGDGTSLLQAWPPGFSAAPSQQRRYWLRRQLEGLVLDGAASGALVGRQWLTVSLPGLGGAVGRSASAPVAVVSRVSLEPASSLLFGHPAASQELRCVGGTGAHSFVGLGEVIEAVAPPIAAFSGPSSVLAPRTDLQSTLTVRPSAALAENASAISCFDQLLPGARPATASVRVAFAAEVRLSVARFLSLGDEAAVHVIVSDAQRAPLPSRFFPLMRLRFEAAPSAATGNTTHSGVAGSSGASTSCCGRGDLLVSSTLRIIEEAPGEDTLSSLTYRVEGLALSQTQLRVVVTNCASAAGYAAAAEGALPGNCSDVTSSWSSLEVVKPLAASPSALVLVPDALLRVQVTGGPSESPTSGGWQLRFSSSDVSVATVSADGTVLATGLGRAILSADLVDSLSNALTLAYASVHVAVHVCLPSALFVSSIGEEVVTAESAALGSVVVGSERLVLSLVSPEGHSVLSFAGPLVRIEAAWVLTLDKPDALEVPWDSAPTTSALSLDLTATPTGIMVTASDLSSPAHASVSASLTMLCSSLGRAPIILSAAPHLVAVVPRLRRASPLPIIARAGEMTLLRLPPHAMLQLHARPGGGRVLTHRYSLVSSSSSQFTVTSAGLLHTSNDCADAEEATLLVEEVLDDLGPATLQLEVPKREARMLRQFPRQTLALRLQCGAVAALALDHQGQGPGAQVNVAVAEASGSASRSSIATRLPLRMLDGRGRTFEAEASSLCAGVNDCSAASLGLGLLVSDGDSLEAALLLDDDGALALELRGLRAGLAVVRVFVANESAAGGALRAARAAEVVVAVRHFVEPHPRQSSALVVALGAAIHFRVGHPFPISPRGPEQWQWAWTWRSTNASVVLVDTHSGESSAVGEGQASVFCVGRRSSATSAEAEETEVERHVRVVGGTALSVALAPLTLDELRRLGSGIALAASRVRQWEPERSAAPLEADAAEAVPAAPSTDPLFFRVAVIATGLDIELEDQVGLVEQRLRFDCGAAAPDVSESLPWIPWISGVAVGPGANNAELAARLDSSSAQLAGLAWQPRDRNSTLADVLASWSSLHALAQPASASLPGLSTLTARLEALSPATRVCAFMQLGFSLPLPDSVAVALSARVGALEPDRRVLLHRSGSGLVRRDDAGATARGIVLSSASANVTFVPALRPYVADAAADSVAAPAPPAPLPAHPLLTQALAAQLPASLCPCTPCASVPAAVAEPTPPREVPLVTSTEESALPWSLLPSPVPFAVLAVALVVAVGSFIGH